MADTEWHGTSEEAQALEAALRSWCECEFEEKTGRRLKTCPSHQLVLDDQRWLDGLLFARKIAQRLKAEEEKP